MTIKIRTLGAQDADAFWSLRLKALEQEPRAFGESVEEHRAKPVEAFRKRLSTSSDDQFVVGAFSGEKLIGTVGFGRNPRAKQRHKGKIWGVFVDEKHRGQGIARRLLSEVLQRASSLSGLERIILTVGDHQSAAKRLYASLGFTVFAHECAALKLTDAVPESGGQASSQYVDEDQMVFLVHSQSD